MRAATPQVISAQEEDAEEGEGGPASPCDRAAQPQGIMGTSLLKKTT